MRGRSAVVGEGDVLEAHLAVALSAARVDPLASGDCSSASSSSKTRSADATPDWSRLTIEATWVSGWVNWREYWMKACTSPSDIVPLATRRPPRTAMTT